MFRDAFESLERRLVYVGGQWSCYSGETGCFQPIAPSEIERIVILSPIGTRDKTKKFARDVVATLELSCWQSPHYFADYPNAVAVFNGMLVLESAVDGTDGVIKFTPGYSPDFRCTGRIGAVYNPNADTEFAQDFIDRTIGDVGATELVLGLVGLALFGEGARFQRALLFYGAGANGKGVLCEFLAALFPTGTRTSVPPSALKDDFGRMQLRGSRLNIVAEWDRPTRDELTLMKAVVTGEPIQARRVGGNGVSFTPHALFIIATNMLPQLGRRTPALERRFVVIPFNNIVPPERRDPYLADTLKEIGLNGLLRLCVDAVNRIYARQANGEPGIIIPHIASAASDRLFVEDVSVAMFVAACVERTGDSRKNRITASAMYDAYSKHCDANGAVLLSQERFKECMVSLGFQNKRTNGIHWTGVQWA